MPSWIKSMLVFETKGLFCPVLQNSVLGPYLAHFPFPEYSTQSNDHMALLLCALIKPDSWQNPTGILSTIGKYYSKYTKSGYRSIYLSKSNKSTKLRRNFKYIFRSYFIYLIGHTFTYNSVISLPYRNYSPIDVFSFVFARSVPVR